MDIAEIGYFLWIRHWRYIADAEKDVVKFVFYQSAIEFRPVDEVKSLGDLALHAHLLNKAAFSGIDHVFIQARMAAASIGPKTSTVVFVMGALLEQKLTAAVQDEDAESAVQAARSVGLHFFHGPLVLVECVDQNNVFLIHGASPLCLAWMSEARVSIHS